MKTYMKNFLICGIAGWCIECTYTGFMQLIAGNIKMTSTTSIWMFPIYGLVAFMSPLYTSVKSLPVILRSFIYAFLIMAVELITGTILNMIDGCPWDYRYAALNYEGVIRLDYFPLWMIAGLIFEYLLFHRRSCINTDK